MGWPVVLSPSGTRMKHDGGRRGRIFHCQSPGGTVIHFIFFLVSGSTLSLCFCVSVKCQFNHYTRVLVSCEWRELSNQSVCSPFRQRLHTKKQKYAGEDPVWPWIHLPTYTHARHLSIQISSTMAQSTLSPPIRRVAPLKNDLETKRQHTRTHWSNCWQNTHK